MDRRTEILQTAREQIQRKGYNGFSYADIANAVGIRKASIHHHFATKADLGKAVAMQYSDDFLAMLDQIAAQDNHVIDKLKAYIELFKTTLERDNKVCLCMMLAADQETLPDTVKGEVAQFFTANEQWLTELLHKGQQDKQIHLSVEAQFAAASIFSALEGAMIIAEPMNDTKRLQAVSDWIVSSLQVRN